LPSEQATEGPGVGPTMRVAVVGGGGFIGRHVARALSAVGHDVRIVDRECPIALAPDHDVVVADITDLESLTRAVAGVDGVFHLAAALGVEACLARESEVLAVNRDGVGNVLAACNAAGVRRLLFASSSEV